MNATQRPEGQEKIKQTLMVDLIKKAPLRNGEYVLDCCDGAIKMSQLRKRDVSEQAVYTQEEFALFLQHRDLDKGQYSVVVDNGNIVFKLVKKYWMNQEDFS